MRLADSGKTLGKKLSSALGDSLLAAIVAFALFSLVLGLRTVDSATGLTLEPRPALLATVVAIVFVGRLALNLFVWQTDYPLTRPFAKLFRSEPFETRDAVTLALAFVLGALGVAAGFLFTETLYGLIGALVLAFIGIGLLRRATVRTFPNLPYTQVFVAGGILFALFFPIVSYALESTFNLGLPLRYWFDLSILILTYVMLGWGLNIVVGLAGLLDLGYVAFYAVGAYTFALLATHFGLGFWICLPIAGAAAALWGIVLGFPVLRLRGDYLAIVTLAFGEIVRIILLNWTEVTGGPNGIASISRTTDSNGFVHFSLPAGSTTYTLSAARSGYTTSTSQELVTNGATTQVTKALSVAVYYNLRVRTSYSNRNIRVTGAGGFEAIQSTNWYGYTDFSLTAGTYSVQMQTGYSGGNPVWGSATTANVPADSQVWP